MNNTSAFAADDYDSEILRTVPFYNELYRQIAETAKAFGNKPLSWLDIGCGTGKTAESVLGKIPLERFVFADISEEMLEISKSRFRFPEAEFIVSDISGLSFCGEFDIVTAVLVSYYLKIPERKAALENCFRALKKGGILITAENFAPSGTVLEKLYLKRWESFQIEQGKAPEACRRHLERYGKSYFPVTISESLDLLRGCGFAESEVFALSGCQAAFIAVK
ncbi:MAG: class I SAM-dependent methyltransferase [Oscillospiraceae bacterium]|nr:class I SAM-dependent methyltransferase [Oscillospiraceae bacterium]